MQRVLDFFVYIAHIVQKMVIWLLDPVYAWKYDGLKKQLSPAASPLVTKSATELARMIRCREVRCVSVLESFISRIRQVNGDLNAMVGERFEDALNEAHEVDRILDSGSVPERYSERNAPFLGVPFTAKEAFAIEGMPNSSGLLHRRAKIADSDAVVVSLLRQAGAIPIAVTNCSEVCLWMESSNLVYGRTNNPYHLGRTVGGSSGGEGSLVGAAGSVIGVGSDTGGSIRIPCYFNGIFGHKPTTCVVDNAGQFPTYVGKIEEYLVTGPICRYADDLLPMLKIMAGKGLSKLQLDEPVNLKNIKVYYMLDNNGALLSTPVQKEIRDSITSAASHLGTINDQAVMKVCFPLLKKSLDMWSTLMSAAGHAPFCNLLGNGKPVNPFGELLRWLLYCPRHTIPTIILGLIEQFPIPQDVDQMRTMVQCLQKEMSELLGDNGVFLYPSHPTAAPYHNQPVIYTFNWTYTAIINVLGFPSTQVPMGVNSQGLPIGLQVVGNFHRDHVTIAVAKELEKAFGGWVPPYNQ